MDTAGHVTAAGLDGSLSGNTGLRRADAYKQPSRECFRRLEWRMLEGWIGGTPTSYTEVFFCRTDDAYHVAVR